MTCTAMHLQGSANSILICHGHFKQHWTCWVIRHKWQSSLHSSLGLLQNLLLFWAPLKTSSFSYHSAMGQHTQMSNVLPSKSKEIHLTLYLFFGCRRDRKKFFFPLPQEEYLHIPHTAGSLEISLQKFRYNVLKFFFQLCWV